MARTDFDKIPKSHRNSFRGLLGEILQESARYYPLTGSVSQSAAGQRPVTPEVAGSSPVGPATLPSSLPMLVRGAVSPQPPLTISSMIPTTTERTGASFESNTCRAPLPSSSTRSFLDHQELLVLVERLLDRPVDLADDAPEDHVMARCPNPRHPVRGGPSRFLHSL